MKKNAKDNIERNPVSSHIFLYILSKNSNLLFFIHSKEDGFRKYNLNFASDSHAKGLAVFQSCLMHSQFLIFS